MAKNEFVTERNITVRSVHGVVVKFKKGVPTYVPPQAQNEAIAVGAQSVDGEVLPDKEEVVSLPGAPTGDKRSEQIKEIIRAMVKRNERGDFTSANKPDARVITKFLKFRVESDERDRLWDEVYHENDPEE